MDNSIAVSVIVPIYNAEKYLRQCLDSIINQTLQELEIILVDDGSTDASGRICEEYAHTDERIKVIHTQNCGACAARKRGTLECHGKYIGVVDADDWINPNMYERLYALAVSNVVEIVSSGYFLEGNYTTEHLDTLDAGMYTEDRLNDLRDAPSAIMNEGNGYE